MRETGQISEALLSHIVGVFKVSRQRPETSKARPAKIGL